MKCSLRALSCIVVLAVAAPGVTVAADKATEKPAVEATPGKEKAKYTPLYAQVESITDTGLTVKGTGPDTKFVINAETKISKDKEHKEPAKASDVKVGQWVGGSYTKAADGTNVLHSLHLGVSQKGDQKGEKKGEHPAAPK